MHQADRAGAARAFNNLVTLRFDNALINGAGKYAIMPMRVKWPLMACGDDLKRTIFQRYIIKKKQAGDHVVIGHWLEQKVLMPFHRGRRAGEF